MKLGEKYGTDKTLEEQGTWVELGDGAAVKLARLGNPKHNKAVERLRKPFRGFREIPQDSLDKLAIESLVEAIVLDWRGIVDDDGKNIPFTPENVRDALTRYRDFREEITRLAGEQALFRREVIEEASKNLKTTSPGASSTAQAG